MAVNDNEIVLPITEPETEWILGRAVRKVSPRRTHGRLQAKLLVALCAWSEARGEVASDWRFRPAPPGEPHRPLVPDVAFVTNERLRGLRGDELEMPLFSPDVAFEILSPRDEPERLRHKIEVYLSSGASLVAVVEPNDRSVALHDRDGVRILRGDEVLTHRALPEFALPLPELFAVADPPR
ncbi:MAG TPA: Uma2 family endonuclease [Candidatus Baltobacteraceae bacterium]|nr:Uma2 family endonuclease [Candidatus Baltobacteraceae bacterium]